MHLGALTRVTYGLTNGQALSGVGHRDASTYKTAKIKLSCWLNFNSTLVMTCLCLTFDFLFDFSHDFFLSFHVLTCPLWSLYSLPIPVGIGSWGVNLSDPARRKGEARRIFVRPRPPPPH